MRPFRHHIRKSNGKEKRRKIFGNETTLWVWPFFVHAISATTPRQKKPVEKERSLKGVTGQCRSLPGWWVPLTPRILWSHCSRLLEPSEKACFPETGSEDSGGLGDLWNPHLFLEKSQFSAAWDMEASRRSWNSCHKRRETMVHSYGLFLGWTLAGIKSTAGRICAGSEESLLITVGHENILQRIL